MPCVTLNVTHPRHTGAKTFTNGNGGTVMRHCVDFVNGNAGRADHNAIGGRGEKREEEE
jgi:hypothetical protein